ncbi:unnamed protein product [Arabis nemorensis]|uniref:RRM domain-containing protein n=1 Tax=Arabis nemorensis TaxID=586526 RepID=A0A565CI71_9BRAS|nr:unnamed protein product [Arabis nemorensis]
MTPRDVIKTLLTNHFSSCGEIVDLTIRAPTLASSWSSGCEFNAHLFIVGEGAEEKALQLNASVMGGRKLAIPTLRRRSRGAKGRMRGFNNYNNVRRHPNPQKLLPLKPQGVIPSKPKYKRFTRRGEETVEGVAEAADQLSRIARDFNYITFSFTLFS